MPFPTKHIPYYGPLYVYVSPCPLSTDFRLARGVFKFRVGIPSYDGWVDFRQKRSTQNHLAPFKINLIGKIVDFHNRFINSEIAKFDFL